MIRYQGFSVLLENGNNSTTTSIKLNVNNKKIAGFYFITQPQAPAHLDFKVRVGANVINDDFIPSFPFTYMGFFKASDTMLHLHLPLQNDSMLNFEFRRPQGVDGIISLQGVILYDDESCA